MWREGLVYACSQTTNHNCFQCRQKTCSTIKNPNLRIWNQRLTDSWAGACSEVTLQSIPEHSLYVSFAVLHSQRRHQQHEPWTSHNEGKTTTGDTLNKTCQHPSPNSLPFGAAQWGTCSSCSQCTKPAALLRKGNRRGSDRMLHQGTSAFNSTMKTSPTTQTLIAASLYNTIVSSCSSQRLFSWLQCKANNYEKRDAFSNSSLLFSSGAWLNGFINLYPVTQATYPSTCASKWKPGFDSATSVSELLSFPRCRQ